MAERRMFAKTIIDSDAFLDMPPTTQLLYFHLSMRADDDGFVNKPKSVMRMIGATQGDIEMLIIKKFIIPFESGIVVIKHWKIHNYIINDRYTETKYKEEKALLQLDENNSYTTCLPSDNQMDTNGIPSDNQMDTNGIPSDNQMDTQDRLGKDRLGKDRLDIHTAKAVRTDYQHYVDLYNSHCNALPQVKTLNDKRKRLIKRVAREVSEDDLLTALNKANTNSFLRGDSGGWKANFDWLMNPDNITKVLEGNYDRGKTQNSTNKDYDTDFGVVIEV